MAQGLPPIGAEVPQTAVSGGLPPIGAEVTSLPVFRSSTADQAQVADELRPKVLQAFTPSRLKQAALQAGSMAVDIPGILRGIMGRAADFAKSLPVMALDPLGTETAKLTGRGESDPLKATGHALASAVTEPVRIGKELGEGTPDALGRAAIDTAAYAIPTALGLTRAISTPTQAWNATRAARALGEDYHQATRDTMAALNIDAETAHRARPYLEAAHRQGIPIVGKDAASGAAMHQVNTAAALGIDEIEGHIRTLVAQFPREQVPPLAAAVTKRVAAMPGGLSSDLDAAQGVIMEYGLDQPRSLAEAEGLRIRLNADNRAFLEAGGPKQRTAAISNPTYVARQEAANQLRDEIYGRLQKNGVAGIRELRLDEGALAQVRKASDPLTRSLKSEAPVARTGVTSLGRRLVQRVAPMAGAGLGAVVTSGSPMGAAIGTEIGEAATAGLTAKNLSRNALLERAFAKQFTDPPVMSVQGFRSPNSTALRRPLALGPAQPPALPPVSLEP